MQFFSLFSVALTSQPNNESELQLYRVLQRANLLTYYDTFISQGRVKGHYYTLRQYYQPHFSFLVLSVLCCSRLAWHRVASLRSCNLTNLKMTSTSRVMKKKNELNNFFFFYSFFESFVRENGIVSTKKDEYVLLVCKERKTANK